MPVSLVHLPDDFAALSENWNAIYALDSQAQVFVSWAWLNSFFDLAGVQWCVLAYRPEGRHSFVAFLPLNITRHQRGLVQHLNIGSTPIADYGGMLCLPGYENAAIESWAAYIRTRLQWDFLHTGDTFDPRLQQLCQAVAASDLDIGPVPSCDCPILPLPDSFDTYLQESMSRSSRQSLRRRIRGLEKLPGYRQSSPTTETLPQHIDALLSMWQQRWGHYPFDYRNLFQHYFASGRLWLDVLWLDESPIAALAAFPDPVRRTFYYYISGFSPAHEALSPGRVIVAASIRYAIENGYQAYDFLRGDESYKFSMGAQSRMASAWQVERRSMKLRLFHLAQQTKRRLQHLHAPKETV